MIAWKIFVINNKMWSIIKFIIVDTNLIINSKIWSYLQNLIVDRKYLLIIEKKLLITVLNYWWKKNW
jgi:hypothetical protein